jgi:hypothetical protein
LPSIDELRARSADLFAGLAEGRTGAERATAGRDRPFSWFNPDDAAEAVGLAAQLGIVAGAAPTEDAELDKLLVEVPADGHSVVYRPDTEFSVVKKPAESGPQLAADGGGDPSDQNYCDCGWPYALLLPRGTPDGMAFRLAVLCTDGARDLVLPSAECGSMSFCGAVDRYPDTREMGYPFSRPFARPVADTILGLPSAAGRSLTIRHEQ